MEFDQNKTYVYRCFRWLTNEIIKSKFINEDTSIDNVLDKFYETISRYVPDWYSMTDQEKLDLGFIQYEGATCTIWLIPLWMMPLIPENIELCDINGESFIYNSKTSPKTVMFNCLTYGLKGEAGKVVTCDY